MFMSPNLARRVAGVGIGVAPPLSPRTSARRRRCEDEMDLIMPTSPTSSEVNGNGEAEEEAVANVEVVGFASPRKFRSAVPQRVRKVIGLFVCHSSFTSSFPTVVGLWLHRPV